MLATALRMLSEQLRPADEIIVVDNGSTDNSVAVARDARAIVLTQPWTGIGAAAATGYDAAHGDIIARLDADSRAPVDWLMHIEAAFASSPGLDIITGPGDFYGGNSVVTLLGQRLYIGGFFWSMSLWLGNPPVFGSNFAMRREVWADVRTRVHSSIRKIHDDLDLSFHLAPQTSIQLDQTLRVGISARPFATWYSLGRRLGWAYLTLKLHWPNQSPWRRRAAKRTNAANNPENEQPRTV